MRRGLTPWRSVTTAILAAMLCLGLVLEVPGPGAGQPRGGGAASMAIFGAPGSVILPDFTATGFAVTVSQVGNRALISYSPNLRMVPDLAERWTISPDGRTYTFTLRPGIRWSDGAPITSQDVLYTVLAVSSSDTTSDKVNQVSEIVGASERKGGRGEAVSGFKIVGDRVFQVTTVAPSADFLDLFGTELMPLPRHSLEAVPLAQLQKSDFARVPSVSSGPFTVAAYQTDTLVTMTRNEYYYGRRPSLDRLYVKILTPETAVAQLERGELQVIPGELSGELPPQDVPLLNRNPDIAVTSYPNTTATVIYPNLKRKPLDDVRVRQAMMYAIDRRSIVANALLGMAQVAYSPFASFTPWYDKSLNPYAYDPAHAKQLLAEAHYDPSAPTRFLVPTGDTTVVSVGTIVAQMLRSAGMNVTIEQTDFATAVHRLVVAHDFDLAIVGNRGYNDPDLSRRFSTGAITTGVNSGQYSNPEMDRLLDQARQTVDPRKQKPLLNRIQEIVNTDVPVVLLFYRDSIGAVNTKQLGGAVPRFLGVFRDSANWYLKP